MPADPSEQSGVLVELVHTDLEFRLKAGKPARVEDYLRRYPELAGDAGALGGLVRAEWDFRRRREPDLRWEEYRARFPRHAADQPPPTDGHAPFRGLAPGTRLGKYALEEVVGRGAFGVVYRARDTELDRVVAVKVPRPGCLAGPDDAARFLREARNAAQLRHPRIVAVHDAGCAGDTCFLVSAFVPGQTLAQRLQAGRLPLREAVGLLAAVAEAIHYAHAQGVIHRDLKPSNVLLDEAGRPNVTDFGLAKRATVDTTLTRAGELLGTPGYVSPEQARGAADGRSDVYSLGVILYELLTGELPFRGTAAMVVQQVLYEEPRSVRRLNEQVPRDLETVCAKAMAKEPARRYATAQDLADDLRRFLAGEPIRARPAGRMERLVRWCRRKPLVAALSGALLLAFAAGFAGVIWQWRRAEANLHQAKDTFRHTLEAINTYNDLSHNRLRIRPSMERLRLELLTKAVELNQRLLQLWGDDRTIRQNLLACYEELGALNRQLGRFQEAREAFGRGRELAEQLPEEFGAERLASSHFYFGLLDADTGRFEEALEGYRRAGDLWDRLRALRTERQPWYHRCWALTYCTCAEVYQALGRSDEARRCFEMARPIQEQLARDHPDDHGYQEQLAYADYVQGVFHLACRRASEAARFLEQARGRRERVVAGDPEDIMRLYYQAQTDHRYGAALLALGRHEEALASLQRARATFTRLAADSPLTVAFPRNLAGTYLTLGRLHVRQDRWEDARGCFEQSRDLHRRLLDANQAVLVCQEELAESYTGLGDVARRAGQPAEARRCYEQAQTTWERLAHNHPGVPAFRSGLAGVRSALAGFDPAAGPAPR